MWWQITFLATTLLVSLANADNTPVCTQGFTLSNNKCLKLYTTPGNFTASEGVCMRLGATLVTIKNAIDNRALANFVGSSASLVWIGLFCEDSSPDKCYWDDSTGSTKMYNNFSPGFPLIDVGRCVYYSTQGSLAGRWLNGACSDTIGAFVCELPTTLQDDCEHNYNGYCYSSVNAESFDDAQTQCERQGAELASIHSANENRYITTTKIMDRYVYETLGIGGLQPTLNSFRWSDGSPWDYNNVNTEYSMGYKCLAMSKGTLDVPAGAWFAVDCNTSNEFLCKRVAGSSNIGTTNPVTVTPAPTNPPNCNSTLLIAPGVITSPNYPNNYPPMEFSCSYQLAALGPYRVVLQFNYMSLGNDGYIDVFDSDNSRIGEYRGSSKPRKLMASGQTMLVIFTSPSPYNSKGFSATYSYET